MKYIKKILKSLLALGIIGLIGFGVTQAFFSDEEKSVGNTFQAGKIDLKVDHVYASYNGNECSNNCVENLGTNLIENGSFETPEVTDPAKWQIFPSGTVGLAWIVEWNGGSTTFDSRTRPDPALAEYHEGVLGSAQDGDQYAELDSDWYGPSDPLNGEPALIKIYQNINTTVGAKYKLHYYFSPRPNTGSGDNILTVKIDNAVVQTTGPVAGGGSIVWTEYTYEFTAANSVTKVEFVGDGTNNSLGVFLDNVTLHPYDCTYQLANRSCNLWEEKDLGTGDFFWNFDDIKPGDYGRNVISLHVYDNDYYACLLSDKEDLENEIIDPEAEAGDITSFQGELSKYIDIFIWNDLNHNGIYEPSGENSVYENGFPDSLPLNQPPNAPWTASDTHYLGVAWCVGDQTVNHTTGEIICSGTGNQNDAQTDTLNVDLKFYAEQSRNNSDFSCSKFTPTVIPITPT